MSIISDFTENSGGAGVVRTRGALAEVFLQQEKEKDEMEDDVTESLQPEPSRRLGPLPSIPRPSTALGTARHLQAPPLIEDTEVGRGLARPRSSSSMMASNMTLDEEFDTDYLRYGGTVGVRNPRLVAQMRGGVRTGQQQQQ